MSQRALASDLPKAIGYAEYMRIHPTSWGIRVGSEGYVVSVKSESPNSSGYADTLDREFILYSKSHSRAANAAMRRNMNCGVTLHVVSRDKVAKKALDWGRWRVTQESEKSAFLLLPA